MHIQKWVTHMIRSIVWASQQIMYYLHLGHTSQSLPKFFWHTFGKSTGLFSGI